MSEIFTTHCKGIIEIAKHMRTPEWAGLPLCELTPETHRAGSEGAVLRRSLFVSEARGRGLMLRQRGMVVVMVGLVRRGRGVVVVVIRGVVWGWLLHTGVRRLMTHDITSSVRWQHTDGSAKTESIAARTTYQSLPGSGGTHAVVIIPHVVVRLQPETHVST